MGSAKNTCSKEESKGKSKEESKEVSNVESKVDCKEEPKVVRQEEIRYRSYEKGIESEKVNLQILKGGAFC